MPRRDSTGKQLSGAQKRRIKAQQATGAPAAAKIRRAPDPPLADISAPPTDTQRALLAWAQGVQAQAAAQADLADPARVRAIGTITRALAKLRVGASDSELLIRVLRHHRGLQVDERTESVPEAAIARPAWALWQAGGLLHRVATAPTTPDEGRTNHEARALAQVADLPLGADLVRVAADLDGGDLSISEARGYLRGLLAAAEGDGRHVDMCLILRRLTVDLPQDVPDGWTLRVGAVELMTTGPGCVGVPVVSMERGASVRLRDGDVVDGGGVLRIEHVLRAGGRWDTLTHCYEGEAATQLIFDLMESQVEQARWFSSWLARYKARQGRRRGRDIRTLMDYGNRGGGKTVMGLLAALAITLEVPGTVAWLISASRTQSQDEIHDALVTLLPPSWATYRGQPAYRFLLANGSRLREMTADAPEDLKQGRVDFALDNEGAKLRKLAYIYPLGRISDRGGLLWITTNPPTEDVPHGIWVWRLYRQVQEKKAAGEWFPVHVIRTDAKSNAAIDQDAREDVSLILHALDPLLAAADADGTMQGTAPRLVYQYEKSKHGMFPPPQVGLPDVTEAFTRRKFGRAFSYIAGLDFQDSPYIIASFWKLFGDVDAPILWSISDFTCKGSEDDFLDEVLLQGIVIGEGESVDIEPATVLWIGDSSAQWQDAKHRGQQAANLPPSFAFWKQRGMHIVPPTVKVTPEAKYPKNPPLQVSYGQLNRLVKADRMRLSPHAVTLQEAFAECAARPRVGGGVLAESKYAHAIDTARYVAWWVDPVTKRIPAVVGERRRGVSVLPGR